MPSGLRRPCQMLHGCTGPAGQTSELSKLVAATRHPQPTTTTHQLLAVAGTRQANRVRARYLASVLSQDIPFFDGQPGGALMHALNEDMVALQNAMGEKNGTMLHYLSNFVSGVAVGRLGFACAGPEVLPSEGAGRR